VGKIRPGNKKNSGLNGEWARHVRKGGKKATAGLRRSESKNITRKKLEDSVDEEEDDHTGTPRFDEDDGN
jgi:hypothetical protein